MKKLQLMLLAFCCSLLSVAQSSGDITFSVDMSTYGAPFGTVYVSGDFNSWNGVSNPMTHLGGGIWEATIPALGGGVIEYKFTIDGWAAQEALSPNSICTITNGGYTNRLHYVDGNASIPTVCWNDCFECGTVAPDGGDITLTVDMSSSGATFTQMYISGSFNGWSGVDNAMTDNGDGTWTVTVTMPAGENEYKFTYDDWVGQESLAWYDSCFSNNGGNTNRITYVNGNADLGSVCWNSCGACAGGVNGCTDATASNYNASATADDGSCLYAMTFEVDMSAETGFTTPAVESPLFNWCGGCAPMADQGGGIWSVTLDLPAGDFEYKYSVDNFAGQEDLVDDVVAGCGWCAPITDGVSYANRLVTVAAGATQSDTYGECGPLPGGGCTDSTATNYEPCATVDDGSCVYSGTVVLTVEDCSGTAVEVRLTGPWWGWNPAGGPVASDNGDGTWSVTLVPEVDMEYLWVMDGVQENLLDNSPQDLTCTPVTDGAIYANRLWTVGSGDVTDVYDSCTSCGTGVTSGCTDSNATNYDPAANVDDGSCTYDNACNLPGIVVQAGSFFYSPQDLVIATGETVVWENLGGNHNVDGTTDVIGDGTYTNPENFFLATVTASGSAVCIGEYTFTVPGVYNYNCSIGAHAAAGMVGTITVGVGGCTDATADNYDASAEYDDGSCLYPDVVLTVEDCSGTAVEVRMTGPFWGWDPAGGPVASDNGDGTWSVTLAPEVDMEYLWVIDGVQENLLDNSPQDLSCTPVTDGATYANRLWTVGSGDVTGDVYDSCTSCDTGVTSGCTDSNATNYDPAATVDDGSCVYPDVVLTVEDCSGTAVEVRMTGPFWGWDPAGGPVASDNGDGTWSVTLAPEVDMEYLWVIDGVQENLLDNSPQDLSCTPVTDGATYANRLWTVGSGDVTGDVYDSCTSCDTGVPTSEVTFNVDMSEYSGTEVLGFVNVSGEWNSWCGDCNQMTDNGDGTWSVTLPIPAGDYQYKYTINNWADQEDLVGAGSCVISQGGNTNRTLTVETGVSQTLDLVCFASCYACQTGETPGCNNANASNYDATATVNDGSCLFDVTFNLNTATAGLDFSTEVAHLYGSFNGWCGGCAPMNDDGDGTWSLTVELQEGYYEFKYAADATNTINETLDLILGSCLTENFGFTNRILQVTDDMDLDLVCWESCGDCVAGSGCTDATANNYDASATIDNGTCLYDVIFTVDMANYIAEGGTFTTPEVNGTFNGWCGGCAQMTNTVDDVWTLTIELGAGDYEYQFAVDNWTDQEFGLDPAAACTIGANRALTVSGQTDIGLVCWESCSACATGTFVDVTFRVDMSNETVSPDGVHIAGSFQDWDAAASPMTYLGYGIYEITFVGLPGNQSYWYMYINGNTFASEEVIPAECSVSNNREVAIGDMNTVVDVVCFGECQACAGCTDPFSIEYNPFAGSDDGSCATAVVSGCTYADAENYYMAANSDDGSCIFAPAVSDCPEDLDGDFSIGTTDLLQLLAAFGSSCP